MSGCHGIFFSLGIDAKSRLSLHFMFDSEASGAKDSATGACGCPSSDSALTASRAAHKQPPDSFIEAVKSFHMDFGFTTLVNKQKWPQGSETRSCTRTAGKHQSQSASHIYGPIMDILEHIIDCTRVLSSNQCSPHLYS